MSALETNPPVSGHKPGTRYIDYVDSDEPLPVPYDLRCLYPDRFKPNRRVCVQRPKLPRLKRKERLTWNEWLDDWSAALHSAGFTCLLNGERSLRSRITSKGTRKRESLCLQKGGTTVYLYSSVKALPCVKDMTPEPNQKVFHIVRGRRPEPGKGVKRIQDDSTATGIIPKVKLEGRPDFLVDYDGALFGLNDGVWQEAMDDSVWVLYRTYQKASPHLKSIRPYRRKAKTSEVLHDQIESSKTGFDEYETNSRLVSRFQRRVG